MAEYEAGRELDATIAEKVMGLGHFGARWEGWAPPYSTTMAMAWDVALKLADPYEVRLEMCAEGWLFTIEDGAHTEWWGQAETAPLAICRAALKAVTAPGAVSR